MGNTFPVGGVLKQMHAENTPFIMVDNRGVIVSVNSAFNCTFGWGSDSVIGDTLDVVLPEAFRMSHHLAFSSFSSPEQSKVVGHPLKLKALCSDGREILSEHFIVAEQSDEGWFFGAYLRPLS